MTVFYGWSQASPARPGVRGTALGVLVGAKPDPVLNGTTLSVHGLVGPRASLRGIYLNEEVPVKYVAVAVVGGATGFLIARFLFPVVLERGIVSLVWPILLVAMLLLARAIRRGRAGS